MLNTHERTYTTSEGKNFKLQTVSPLMLERMQNDQWGKPQPPVIEVQYGGKKNGKEANPLDPDYLAALEAWENEKRMQMLSFLFGKGVADEAPEAELADIKRYFPRADEAELRYLWIASYLKTNEDIEGLSEAIASQSIVTKEGLAEAEAIFPGEDQRVISESVSVS